MRQFNVKASEINDVTSDTLDQIPTRETYFMRHCEKEKRNFISLLVFNFTLPSSPNNLISNYNKNRSQV